MANRVTGAEVKEILDTAKIAVDVEKYITAANLTVTGVTSGQGYSTAELKEIERYLAAHLVAIDDPRIKSENFGAAATYHGGSGLGLDHTPQGQQVKLLEYKGKFAELDQGGPSASVKVVG